MIIDEALVRKLVATGFPRWADLAVRAVERSGWDNRSFRLGEDLLVRLPSAAVYAGQVEKEQRWLPILAPHLPVPIPEPVAMGDPGCGFPWRWSIYRWIEGAPVEPKAFAESVPLAASVAAFLVALRKADAAGGPAAGRHSFHRGGSLSHYDGEFREAVQRLGPQIDGAKAVALWESALAKAWSGPPAWVHGDVSPGNLLVDDNGLCAVIDFGQLAVGDPACDLGIAWTLFRGAARQRFLDDMGLDEGTVLRARAWVLWKAVIQAPA